MLRFRIFGFPVTVQPWFWLGAVLIGGGLDTGGVLGLQMLLIWVAVCFASILWHELGHAFLTRSFGSDSEIVLTGLGGYATSNITNTRCESIAVSAAGPLFQLIIGIPIWWLIQQGYLPQNRLGRFAVTAVMQVNIVWPLFNLLPIIPLDGGRISEALFGPNRWRIAYWLSFIVAILAALYFFPLGGGLFMAIMLGLMAWGNWRILHFQPEIPGLFMSCARQTFRMPVSKSAGYRHSKKKLALVREPSAKARARYEPKLTPRAEIPPSHPSVESIDHLLDKIAKDGLGSLTAQERHELENASARLLAKDQKKS